MKAYLLTEKQIASIVEIARSNHYEGMYGARISEDEIAGSVTKELQSEPIELDDVSISEINQPCRFVPKEKIIGFTRSNGFLRGVFFTD